MQELSYPLYLTKKVTDSLQISKLKCPSSLVEKLRNLNSRDPRQYKTAILFIEKLRQGLEKVMDRLLFCKQTAYADALSGPFKKTGSDSG